ncbi:MAG: hypothetical protein ACI9OJ_000546 [Myxococcota bacterium]|jgi:hypothetical protein
MSNEFRGFNPLPTIGDLFGFHRHVDETHRFMAAVVGLLGSRIAAARPHSGRDERGGRDYFFDNVEFHIRGRRDPCFLGFYHYRLPEERQGSFWEVWEWEHDDEPLLRIGTDELVATLIEKESQGLLSNWLDEHSAGIRHELGLD